MVSDSHTRRIKKILFNNYIYVGEAYFNGFSGANSKHLGCFNTSALVEDQADISIIQKE